MLLGLRTKPQLKRVLESLGAIVFHIGVFGILYQKVSIVLFASLVALVLSLFILIDPLKFANFIPIKVFRAIGLFLLFLAIAFATLYCTNYPLWLWILPLVIYFMPYALPPLKRRVASWHFFAWLIVLINMTLITYALYSRLYPEKSYHSLISWFDKSSVTDSTPDIAMPHQTDTWPANPPAALSQEPATTVKSSEPVAAVKTLPNSVTAPAPTKTATASEVMDGPFLQSLHAADEKFLQLKKDFDELQKAYDELKAENEKLKGDL